MQESGWEEGLAKKIQITGSDLTAEGEWLLGCRDQTEMKDPGVGSGDSTRNFGELNPFSRISTQAGGVADWCLRQGLGHLYAGAGGFLDSWSSDSSTTDVLTGMLGNTLKVGKGLTTLVLTSPITVPRLLAERRGE